MSHSEFHVQIQTWLQPVFWTYAFFSFLLKYTWFIILIQVYNIVIQCFIDSMHASVLKQVC